MNDRRMAIFDVFVVNKADRPGVRETAASLDDAAPGGKRHLTRPVVEEVQGIQSDLQGQRINEEAAASAAARSVVRP
jgi:putative protein kinase ArgK-like GTPase of G3E family